MLFGDKAGDGDGGAFALSGGWLVGRVGHAVGSFFSVVSQKNGEKVTYKMT